MYMLATLMISFRCSAIAISVFLVVISYDMYSASGKWHGLKKGDKDAIQFQFPFVCVIQYKYKDDKSQEKYTPVSMCSIYSSTYVITSTDNLDELTNPPSSGDKKRYFQNVDKLYVYAGIADRYPPETPPPGKQQQNRQVKRIAYGRSGQAFASALFAPTTGKVSSAIDFDPSHFNYSLFYLTGKFEWSLALAEVSPKWDWTPYVRPIPLYDISESFTDGHYETYKLDDDPSLRSSCAIASFGVGSYNGLTYRQVTYVPREQCKSAYCSEDLSYCMAYPSFHFEVCFKSLDYMDTCSFDQGSALICEWFDNKTFAILTGAEQCGLYGLPAVYTLISTVNTFFFTAIQQKIEDRPTDDETLSKWEGKKPAFPS